MDFKYIEVVFGRIKKKIEELEKTIIISGTECSGKSHLLKKLNKYYENNKIILFLTPTSALENLEYGVFLSTVSKIGEYNQVVPVATEIISDRNKILGVASDFLINYKKNQLQYQLFSFSEAEIEILNRIALISKKRELLILADDVEKWDSESKKLLGKLIALQNDIECSFFKDTVFVLATNNIKSLNIKISKYYQEVINVDLSYKTFSEEAKKINLSNDKIIHELYDITKGNIGLIANIKEYIDLSSLTGTESLQKQLFQILDKRITSSDKITKEILDALQTATIIGKEFNLYFLNKLLEEPIGILDYYMGLGCEEKFITKEDIQNHYSFSTDTLYNFFVSKLNGRSADCHYKFAKILEKIAPYQFYLRYFHMKQSGNIMEAIPLLTVHCIRQCIEGKKPSEELLNILQEYGNYWNVYQSINYSLKNYRNDNKYTQYYDLIESSDICVHPIVSVEKDYVLCLLKYRTGNINDFKEIEHTLTKYFSEEIDFSQHIRIGLLLFLLYCNRLGEYEKAQKIEKTITWQIQQEISNCEELQKEIRIVERLSPALYSNEVAYRKTKRSLDYFENKSLFYGKEYIMSLTNFLGVGMYVIGTTTDLELSWQSLFSKACKGIEFLNNSFNMNIYGIPKLINNYILVGVLSKNITFQEGIELYDSLLLEKGHLPSKPILECNRLLLEFLDGKYQDIIEKMKILYQNSQNHEYYHFVIGLNYINILIVNNFYQEAEKIFLELNYLVPTISKMDEFYMKKHYNVLNILLEQKICFSSVDEYLQYFEKTIYQEKTPFPDIWKNANVYSDLQYWSEY